MIAGSRTRWPGTTLNEKPTCEAEDVMHDHIYKVMEIVGSSATSIEDAIGMAIARANETIRNLRWFEVVQTRGNIEGGKVAHYQVTLKVGFTMEDAGS
jgi:dodecin